MPPVLGNAALYWNRQGQVNCVDHAPYRYSDTWQNEGWKRITGNRLWTMIDGKCLQCETCHAITREGR